MNISVYMIYDRFIVLRKKDSRLLSTYITVFVLISVIFINIKIVESDFQSPENVSLLGFENPSLTRGGRTGDGRGYRRQAGPSEDHCQAPRDRLRPS